MFIVGLLEISSFLLMSTHARTRTQVRESFCKGFIRDELC